ncbi:MAG: SRPBCC domain-containing protein [Chloroflexota bacterium]
MTTRYTVGRRINAEPEKVWALLADASSYRQWNRAVVSIEGRIAAGETVSLVSIANPRRTFRLHVTELTAPTRMVWRDGMPLGLFTGERTYLVEPREGVTHFEMTEEYTGLLAGVFTKAIPDLTESFNLFADSLKAAAEAPAPT